MDLETVLFVAKALVGIGLVIFVHELGHFLAARWCGVKVDVFSIGMGPRVLSWVRGGTRYQLALLPIGGYVRMAGEDRRLDGLPPELGDLSSKSVGARFFVYSGGVLMNVLFALVVFPVIFYKGVPLNRPVLEVLPGGPAWEQGLRSGTEVLSVDGSETFHYPHVPTAIALGDPEGIEMVIRDPAQPGEPPPAPRTITVTAPYSEVDGLNTIGVAPRQIQYGPRGGYVLEVQDDSPLAEQGVENGAEILGVVGAPEGLPLGLAITQIRATDNPDGDPVQVRIANPGEPERSVTLTPTAGPMQPARVGVTVPHNVVAGLRGRAREVANLREDDRLLSVDGRPLYRTGDLHVAVLEALADAGGAAQVPFELERDGAAETGAFRIASRADALALLDDIALRQDLDTVIAVVNPGEPAALAGLRDGDRIKEIDGVQTTGWADTRKLIQSAPEGMAITFDVARRTADGLEHARVTVTPAEIPSWSYGLVVREDRFVVRADSLGEAIRLGAVSSLRFAEEVMLTLKGMITTKISLKNAGGPISIGAISIQLAATGWPKLFFFLAMLSINLAILNVLPIPLLDGGYLFFLIVEKLKGSPVSERVLVYSQVVGMVLLVSLMVYITYNDFVRWVLPAE